MNTNDEFRNDLHNAKYLYKIDGFKEKFNPLVYKQSNVENSLKTDE
jgi:hypothetical protein